MTYSCEQVCLWQAWSLLLACLPVGNRNHGGASSQAQAKAAEMVELAALRKR